MHQEGFSLVELLVVILVLAIGAGLAAPSFNRVIANAQMSTAVNDFVTTLHVARREALARQTTVVMCAAGAGDACGDAGFGAGWIVFSDGEAGTPADGVRNGGDVVLQRHGPLAPAIATNLSVAPGADVAYVAFGSTGNVIDIGAAGPRVTDVQFCDERGDVDTGSGVAAGRWVRVEAPGRPSIHRLRSEVEGMSPLGGCG
jgi:prepilin-type N-terminal cleavage/methylation domain-containing protein